MCGTTGLGSGASCLTGVGGGRGGTPDPRGEMGTLGRCEEVECGVGDCGDVGTLCMEEQWEEPVGLLGL